MEELAVNLSSELQIEHKAIMARVEEFINRRIGQLRRGHRERDERRAVLRHALERLRRG